MIKANKSHCLYVHLFKSLHTTVWIVLFKSDCTISVVPLNKIASVISGDNVSRGSKVMLNYGSLKLEMKVIGVNDMYVLLPSL